MQELKEHKAYKMLDEKYPQVVLDYVILLFVRNRLKDVKTNP